MSTLEPDRPLCRCDALEITNVVLTTDDAMIGATPREVVWTHRGTTLYRYRSDSRAYPVPILLVFALINRPEIFDLRPGGSLMEYLLGEGFDVFLVDWGNPDEEDAEMGLEDYVCDELHWAIRETLRACGAQELTLMGWCMGATLCVMYCGLDEIANGAGGPPLVRNLALLTMPVEGAAPGTPPGSATRTSMPARRPSNGASFRAGGRLRQQAAQASYELLHHLPTLVAGGAGWHRPADAYQPMAKWVADNPPFPDAPGRSGYRMIYRDDALVAGRVRLRGRRVDPRRVDQNLLVVTASEDHIAPRRGNDADLRPRGERGHHPPRPSRRAHRADRGLRGAQGDLARHGAWLAERSER